MWTLLTASTLAGATPLGVVTCGAPEDRPLTVREVPLGREAQGGRLASMAMVDLDGDGRSEIVGVVVPPFDHAAPMGLWSSPVAAGRDPELRALDGLSFAGLHVLAADIDGTGRHDVIVADPGHDQITRIAWSQDQVEVSPRYSADIGPEPIVADLGPDGVDELLSVSPIGEAAVWSLRSAASPYVIAEGAVPDGVEQAVGDLDGDGAPEWIITQGARSRITVAWGGDLSAQEVFHVPVKDARGVAAVDLDSDGHAELLVMDRRRGAVRLLTGEDLRKGPWVVRLKVAGHADKPQTLAVADLDDDGCQDVMLHSFATHELAIAWGGNRGKHHVQRLRTGAGPLAVGQFDGEPGQDVAVVAGDRVLVLSMPRD